MKLRQGFVSNSSSTSFSIYGTELSDGKLRSLLLGGPEDEEFEDDGNIYELLESISNLETYQDYDNGSVYLGLSWDSIKDNETGKEFKERVQDIIREKLKADLSCRTITETISS
jgi:hypothetical protein